MRKFRVNAEITIRCSRVVDALDEEDAVDQCKGIGANEWIESFTVDSEYIEDLDAALIRPPKRKKADS